MDIPGALQNLHKFLWFPPEQRPLVLQLGGSDPATLAAAAAKAAEYQYDEINLNCGCPRLVGLEKRGREGLMAAVPTRIACQVTL